MPKCTGDKIEFGKLGRRLIEADFSGGDLQRRGHDAVEQADDASVRREPRRGAASRAIRPASCTDARSARAAHLRVVLRLRRPERSRSTARRRAGATAVGPVEALASGPTLCRLETRATRADWALLRYWSSSSSPRTPAARGTRARYRRLGHPAAWRSGMLEFHGYYDHYCYLPLYVFCGKALLACLLRRSRIDGAKHARR